MAKIAKSKRTKKKSPPKKIKSSRRSEIRQNGQGHLSVYITCQSRDEALKIAQTLVSEQIAACFNIFENVTSVYHWAGELEKSTEVAMIGKTTSALADRLMRRVKQLHSYEIPCVVFWRIEDGLPLYLKWLDSNTSAT